jgi:hypothetical protein
MREDRLDDATLDELRGQVHNVVSEDPVARALRTGNSVETHREAWRFLTYLPGIVDELLTLRATETAARALLDALDESLPGDISEPGGYIRSYCDDEIEGLRAALSAASTEPPPVKCSTCRGTGMVPAGGHGSDGFDRCPDCGSAASAPTEPTEHELRRSFERIDRIIDRAGYPDHHARLAASSPDEPADVDHAAALAEFSRQRPGHPDPSYEPPEITGAASAPTDEPEAPMPTICLSCLKPIPHAEYPEHRRGCQRDIDEMNARCRCGHPKVWHRDRDGHEHNGPCEITGPQTTDGCDCNRYTS